MKKKILLLVAITAATATAIISCNEKPAKAPETKTISHDSMVKRGAYLVSVIGCDDCHSPKSFGTQGPEIIMEQRFSGYPADRPLSKIDTTVVKNGWAMFAGDLTAAVGPWGASFAANISSDSTGIGNWTEQQFLKCIREGKYLGIDGTRPLLPPMPWPVYRNMTDEDLGAIFAYLKSTKPVKNIPPQPMPLGDL